MRFLVDECAGPGLAKWLVSEGHDVFSIFEQTRGVPDDVIIKQSRDEARILITNDKDFGELVYRNATTHCGIILLRLEDERTQNKIDVVSRLLTLYPDTLPGAFVVVTEDQVRFAREK
jgi:predicted nuclease of predicted toxin-antitoxin system